MRPISTSKHLNLYVQYLLDPTLHRSLGRPQCSYSSQFLGATYNLYLYMENGVPTEWIVTACILFPLSAGTVFLRLLAVRERRSGLRVPDYLVCLALLCEVGFLVIAGMCQVRCL